MRDVYYKKIASHKMIRNHIDLLSMSLAESISTKKLNPEILQIFKKNEGENKQIIYSEKEKAYMCCRNDNKYKNTMKETLILYDKGFGPSINNNTELDTLLLSPESFKDKSDNYTNKKKFNAIDYNVLHDKRTSNCDHVEVPFKKYYIQHLKNTNQNFSNVQYNKTTINTMNTNNNTLDNPNYRHAFDMEKMTSEAKDQRIKELEDQVGNLKSEKIRIIKNYEELIQKMVLVKDIEKEYAKISRVHESATSELTKLKERVDKYRNSSESLVSTYEVSNNTLSTNTGKDILENINIQKKQESSDLSSKKQDKFSNIKYTDSHIDFKINSLNSTIEKKNEINNCAIQNINYGFIKIIRSISLDERKCQKLVSLSCDKYMKKFGNNIKRIIVKDQILFEKDHTLNANTEYY